MSYDYWQNKQFGENSNSDVQKHKKLLESFQIVPKAPLSGFLPRV